MPAAATLTPKPAPTSIPARPASTSAGPARKRVPAATSTRPPRKPAHAGRPVRTSAIVPTHTRVPAPSIVHGPTGPAIKLTNPAAAKDPRFQKVMHRLQQSAAKTEEHPPARQKAAEAAAAAQPPANEKLAGAQAGQVQAMQDAGTGKVEPESFLATLRNAIAQVMPQTLGDTENFMQGDDKQHLKDAATGNVNQQKTEVTGDLKATSQQPPDPGKVQGKEVVPLPTMGAPPPPPAIGAADAVPAPKPDCEVSLQKSKDEVDQQLKKASITPEQLRKANDPRFSAVLTAKSAVEKQAGSAPQKYRAGEQKTLTQEAAKAVADEKRGLTAMQGERGKVGAAVKLRQLSAKEKDEARRKVVADTIETIYNETKQKVEEKLASLDTDVSDMFDKGIEAAITKMTDYVNQRMDAYKADRYSGVGGDLLWAKDQVFSLPDEVNAFYEEGRDVFTKELDDLVVRIAALVESRLKEAKDEIARGQKRISEYVGKLPKDLQAVGKATEKEIAGRLDELRQGVEDKKNDLAQNLAQRYKEAYDKADEELKKIREENKSLVEKAEDAVEEAYTILSEFRERITNMLKAGRDTIMLIVADPIEFLKNLIDAIEQGVHQFKAKIWEHLKAGFMAWLFGTLESAGIQIPKDLSLGSILKLALQVLDITYEKMRAKAVKLIGERNVAISAKAAGRSSTGWGKATRKSRQT